MKETTIQTLHPEEGKKNKSIRVEKYEMIKEAILNALKGKELTHTELVQAVMNKLKDFEGHIGWYIETVKLDLEARQTIERIKGKAAKYKIKNSSIRDCCS